MKNLARAHIHTLNQKCPGNEASLNAYNQKWRARECIHSVGFEWSPINTHTHMHWAYTQHGYVALCILQLLHRHTHRWHIVYSADTPSHTSFALWQMLAGVLPGRKHFHFFLFSVFWHAYLCTQCGHVTGAVSFSSSSLFFPSSPPCVIIMKLKTFVPREIRRELGKARGTLAKIFLSVMS